MWQERQRTRQLEMEAVSKALAVISGDSGMIYSHVHSMGEERQKTRQLAIEAVSKALAIMSGDSAHGLFTCPFDGVRNARRHASSQ